MTTGLAFSLLLFFVGVTKGEDAKGDDAVDFNGIRSPAGALSPRARSRQEDTSPAARCVYQCMQKMIQANKQSVLQGLAPGKRLEKECKHYEASTACMDKCPDSDVKAHQFKLLMMRQYMCRESTLKQTGQCLYEARTSRKEICDSDTECGPFKKIAEKYKQNWPTTEFGQNEYLNGSCLYTKCYRDCGKDTVMQKCGQAAFDDLNGLVVKWAQLLKYTVDFFQLMTNATLFPNECNEIIAQQ